MKKRLTRTITIVGATTAAAARSNWRGLTSQRRSNEIARIRSRIVPRAAVAPRPIALLQRPPHELVRDLRHHVLAFILAHRAPVLMNGES